MHIPAHPYRYACSATRTQANGSKRQDVAAGHSVQTRRPFTSLRPRDRRCRNIDYLSIQRRSGPMGEMTILDVLRRRAWMVVVISLIATISGYGF